MTIRQAPYADLSVRFGFDLNHSFHLLKNMFSPVGFKGNLVLVDIRFFFH